MAPTRIRSNPTPASSRLSARRRTSERPRLRQEPSIQSGLVSEIGAVPEPETIAPIDLFEPGTPLRSGDSGQQYSYFKSVNPVETRPVPDATHDSHPSYSEDDESSSVTPIPKAQPTKPPPNDGALLCRLIVAGVLMAVSLLVLIIVVSGAATNWFS